MIKRLPILFLALAVALSCSWGFGAKVSAASPIIYDGTVTWAIGRRNSSAAQDFNYGIYQEPLPRYGNVGTIYPELCGIPSNRSTSTFTNLPAFISIQSRELVDNGGYIHLAFCLGYNNDSSLGIPSFSYSGIQQKISRAGSLAYAMSNGGTLTRDQNFLGASASNSAFEIDFVSPLETDKLYLRGVVGWDGSNFPHNAYMLQMSQYLNDIGMSSTTVYGYGDTSTLWARTYFYSCRIRVPANPGSGNNTVWVDLTNAITGNFKSTLQNKDILNADGDQVGTTQAYLANCIYLCPIFCYATSEQNYDTLQQYLEDIRTGISNLNPGSDIPQSVLESYAALGSEAREAAHAAASQMAQNYPTYDPSAMDVSNIVDPTAKAQFKSIMGFLTNNKIIRIIGVVFTLVLIGFVFFGKK